VNHGLVELTSLSTTTSARHLELCISIFFFAPPENAHFALQSVECIINYNEMEQ